MDLLDTYRARLSRCSWKGEKERVDDVVPIGLRF